MSGAPEPGRATWVEVDLDAITHNVGALRPDGADLMAVVKADGYGHGAVQVAGAALEGGAAWLGVALVEEGLALRRAGIDAPILVLSEFPAGTERAALDAHLTPSLYTRAALHRLHDAAAGARVGVHVKIDTGMHRVGVWPPDELTAFLGSVRDCGFAAGRAVDPSRELGRRRRHDEGPARSLPGGRHRRPGPPATNPACSTPRTPPVRSCIRRRSWTWCAPGSGSTAWNRRRGWAPSSSCAPR